MQLEPEIESLWINVKEIHRRCRALEARNEILDSPLWKKLWWWLWRGWPMHRVAERPAWRPW